MVWRCLQALGGGIKVATRQAEFAFHEGSSGLRIYQGIPFQAQVGNLANVVLGSPEPMEFRGGTHERCK